MQKRRSRGILLVATLVLVGIGAVVCVTPERLSFLTRAWDTLASSLASSLPSFEAAPSSSANGAGAAKGDAGTTLRRQTAPLSSAQLGAPLVHGAFVSACGATDDMKVVVKIAVKMGRAVDVNVKTEPPNPTVASCVERATRDLKWDVSPKTDHATVTFEPGS